MACVNFKNTNTGTVKTRAAWIRELNKVARDLPCYHGKGSGMDFFYDQLNKGVLVQVKG